MNRQPSILQPLSIHWGPFLFLLILLGLMPISSAQSPPYDHPPQAHPPYYRVRYEGSNKPGELLFPVQYTLWIPEEIQRLRGIVVHQHGCGEGSCKSGQTGAFDLHWQALARKHHCALLSPSYEQPEGADCQMWCDPRNGSDQRFQTALKDLGAQSGHPELERVPWALWGHSGGGHWAGGMTLLHPERVVCAWLRSGVPLLEPNPERPTLKPHILDCAALQIPILCNLGTLEGVTDKSNRFAGVWPANELFFKTMRKKGALIGVAIDPFTSHECGNQRYLAIPWFDICLTQRLPEQSGSALKPMSTHEAWLAPLLGTSHQPSTQYQGDPMQSNWLPNASFAQIWQHYITDTSIPDTTPPPAPTNLSIKDNQLTWRAEADLESGLAYFIIERDGHPIGQIPESPENRYGRPIFQGLQYSDTPSVPLVTMTYLDTTAKPNHKHCYRIVSVNTVGLRSDLKP